jgi:hypothetical protein
MKEGRKEGRDMKEGKKEGRDMNERKKGCEGRKEGSTDVKEGKDVK